MSDRSDVSGGDRGGRRGPGGAVSASGRGRPAEEEARTEGEPRAGEPRSPDQPPAPGARSTAPPPSGEGGPAPRERARGSGAAREPAREGRPGTAGGRERYVDERGRERERYVDEGEGHRPVAERDTRGPGADLERGRGAGAGNTPAILAAALGVASVLSLLVSLGALFFLALPLGIAAIVLGFMGKRRADHRPSGRQGTAAKVGLGLGAVGTAVSLLAILLLLLGVSLIGGAISGLNREVDRNAQQEEQGDTQRQRDELARRAARQREELARRAARQREELQQR